jgi:peptidoglycan hydrolase FlgJ
MDSALSSLPAGLPAPKTSAMVERLSKERTAHGPVDESKIDPAVRGKLRKAADEFESTFVSQMFGMMMQGVEVDDTFGGGHGEEMFRSMLTNEYGKQVTNRGGFGLADSVYKELLHAQEARSAQL